MSDSGSERGYEDGGEPSVGQVSDAKRVVNQERRQYTQAITGVSGIVGCWVVVSVFIYIGLGPPAFWNNVLIGTAVALAAGYNYYRQHNEQPLSIGVAALIAVLGLWLAGSALVFEMAPGARLSTITSGILLALLAGYTIYSGRAARAAVGETSS